MQTIPITDVPESDVEALEQFAGSVGPQLRDVIFSLSKGIREGAEVAVFEENATFTPNEASARLGLSRTYLYKLLDRGEMPSHRVGRDRRIKMLDLLEFEQRRRRDRDELAERFASQSRTRNDAIDELAASL